MKMTMMLGMRRPPALACGLGPFRRVLFVFDDATAPRRADGRSRSVVARFNFGDILIEIATDDTGEPIATLQYEGALLLGGAP